MPTEIAKASKVVGLSGIMTFRVVDAVDDKPTKITIFILGALSWTVHIGVARRRRSTNRHTSRRTVPRLGDHEKIEPLREYRICDSEVFVSQRVDVPRRQPKTICG